MPEWTKTEFDLFYSSSAEPWGKPHTRPAIKLHYHWLPIGQYQKDVYAPKLYDCLRDFGDPSAPGAGIAAGDAVVIVGCGFNWTGEGLEALGLDVVGVDTSSYLHSVKDATEENEIREAIAAVGLDPDTATVPDDAGARQIIGQPTGPMPRLLDYYLGPALPRGRGDILNETMGNGGSRRRVRQALNSDPRYVVSEEMLNSLTDAEGIAALTTASEFIASEAPSAKIVHAISPQRPGNIDHPTLNWKTYADWRAFLDSNGFAEHGILPTVFSPTEDIHAYSRIIWAAGDL